MCVPSLPYEQTAMDPTIHQAEATNYRRLSKLEVKSTWKMKQQVEYSIQPSLYVCALRE